MKYTTLDKVVKGYLLQRGYPIHFYIDCLIHAVRCFEELHFDLLGNVRAVKLPINSYKAVPLPCDYMDYCKVGIANGQFVQPLTERPGISRLNNFDATTGDKVAFGDDDASDISISWPDTINFNDRGENLGRKFGYTGHGTNTFKVIKERQEIQLDEDIDATHIILEYISDGSEADNATQITPYAKTTIEAYMGWKLKENGRSYGEGERDRAQRLYRSALVDLRGRMNPGLISYIKKSMRRRTHGSIK